MTGFVTCEVQGRESVKGKMKFVCGILCVCVFFFFFGGDTMRKESCDELRECTQLQCVTCYIYSV